MNILKHLGLKKHERMWYDVLDYLFPHLETRWLFLFTWLGVCLIYHPHAFISVELRAIGRGYCLNCSVKHLFDFRRGGVL